MPFFILGLGWGILGTLVTKTVRGLYNSYFPQGEREGYEEETTAPEIKPRTSAASEHPAVLQNVVDSDKCKNVCRFPNRFNNCWMNATLQATLNLNIVRDKLMLQPPQSLIQKSITPTFAGLFLTALKHPGRSFHPQEILCPLTELSDTVPELHILQNNDPLDLLYPLLDWFSECGVKTTFQAKEEIRCAECKLTTSRASNFGNICILPQQGKNDSVFSLLQLAMDEDQGKGVCAACGWQAETEKVWNDPDILTLYVTQPAYEPVFTNPVAPSRFVEIPVSKDKTQLYCLSSAICRRSLNAYIGHFWSYLFCDHATIKADDWHISATADRPDKNGMVYFYEKVRGLEEQSPSLL